jgi:hypothetical protein
MVVKKRCTICKEVVDPKGVYQHVKNKHSDLVERWDEVKEELFEEVEVMEERGEGERGSRRVSNIKKKDTRLHKFGHRSASSSLTGSTTSSWFFKYNHKYRQ